MRKIIRKKIVKIYRSDCVDPADRLKSVKSSIAARRIRESVSRTMKQFVLLSSISELVVVRISENGKMAICRRPTAVSPSPGHITRASQPVDGARTRRRGAGARSDPRRKVRWHRLTVATWRHHDPSIRIFVAGLECVRERCDARRGRAGRAPPATRHEHQRPTTVVDRSIVRTRNHLPCTPSELSTSPFFSVSRGKKSLFLRFVIVFVLVLPDQYCRFAVPHRSDVDSTVRTRGFRLEFAI